jgi:hypothetical protein
MSLRRTLGRPTRKQTVAVCFGFCVALLLLISSGFYFTMQVPKTSLARTDADRRVGEIRLAPTKDGSCRSIKFDNRSGQLGEEKMIDCYADPMAQNHLGPFESLRKNLTGR